MKISTTRDLVKKISLPTADKILTKEERRRTIWELTRYLQDCYSDSVYKQAVKRLKDFGQDALKELAQQLEDSNKYVRKDAAKALGEFGELAIDVIPKLIERIKLDDPELVGKEALNSLIKIGNKINNLGIIANELSYALN